MRDWYQLLQRLPWVRGYLRELQHIYQIIKPADEITIEKSVKRVLKGNLLLSLILAGVFLSFRGATVYLYGILVMTAVIVNRQWVKQRLLKEEKRLLEQLEKYLGDVRHHYHTGGLIEEAIYDSLEQAPYEIALHMHQIYDILTEEDKEADIRYRELAPNKFLTTFLALCQITIEYGDSIWEGSSLFLINLNYLREEIRIELLKREKTAYVFSGLFWISLLPVFFLKVIENWGIQNLPELENYYHGTYGIVVSFLIFLGTFGSCQMISRLKAFESCYKNHYLLGKIGGIPWLQQRIKAWIFTHPKKAAEVSQILQRCEAGLRLPEFIVKKLIYTAFGAGLVFIMTFHISLLKHLFWPFAFVLASVCSLLAGFLAGKLPEVFLALLLLLGKREKEDEVLQFHSIIIMLIHLKRMNAETILCWMENFSRFFKASLAECVDNFSCDNEGALLLLKEREPYLPFVRLVENFEACDRVGVEKAFDEIAGQRSYFLEKRKQDNEIIITEKGAFARVLAYLPMVLTLLLYLIVPFVLESILQLSGYMLQVSGQ